MWSRLRRKTMAPRRPLLYPEQVPLAVVTLLALAAGVWFVLDVIL